MDFLIGGVSNLCIIGSCVTRDIWRVVGEDFSGKYFARTSFISLMSEPMELKEAEINLESEFQRNAVIADANRSALEWIARNKPEILIIDFIDERFDLWKVANSYLLRSVELFQSGLIEASFAEAQLIHRMTEECTELWGKSVVLFAEFMRTNSPETQIILHKARWATESTDGVTRIQFSDKMTSMGKEISLSAYNVMALRYFDIAEHAFGGKIIPIEASVDLLLASQKHTWGVAPIHYIDEYYREVWRKMRSIF